MPEFAIDYTSKDYESFRQDMLNLIPLKTPEWTDYSSTDLGVVLLEGVAYCCDILSDFMDRMANEAFLVTATQRRSVLDHCKSIGYIPRMNRSAKVIVQFTFEAGIEPVTLPVGFLVATKMSDGQDPVFFETDTDLVIPGDNTGLYRVGAVSATQGETVRNDILGSSTGAPSQTFSFRRSPVIENSYNVFVDSGAGFEQWTVVPNFISSGPTDKHYTVFVDEDDIFYVTFGNGLNGKIPSQGTNNVRASYRVGGGVVGNVGAGTILDRKATFPSLVSLINPEGPYELGSDKESITEIQAQAPVAISAGGRAVTAADYIALANDYPGVAKSAVDAVYGMDLVKIYIAGVGGVQPSNELILDVQSYLQELSQLLVEVRVEALEFQDVDIVGVVHVKQGYSQATVQSMCMGALQELMSFDKRGIGQPVYPSQVVKAVQLVSGVDYFELALPASGVIPDKKTMLRLGAGLNLSMVGGVV